MRGKRRRGVLADSVDPIFQEDEDDPERQVKASKIKAETFASDATCLATQGDYKGALQAYGRALAINPDHAVLLEECAQVHLALGHYFEAIKLCHRAEETAKGRHVPFVHLTLGRAQLSFGEPQMALASLRLAVSLFEQQGDEETLKEAQGDLRHVTEVLKRKISEQAKSSLGNPEDIAQIKDSK